MQLGDIYDFFVREGVKTDPRERSLIKAKLRKSRREFQKVEKTRKKFFDKESFANPFADTRILFGKPQTPIHTILVGIDIEPAELLLADRLRQAGEPIDLVLAHHPEGVALAGLDEVMDLQTEVLARLGIRSEIAKDLMERRIKEVGRRLHAGNHNRSVDAARLLNIPYLCCHTPADNHVTGYLATLMKRSRPKRLKDIIDLLSQEPEYQDAMRCKAGPRILIGKPADAPGRICVDMTGGTEGSKEIFGRLSQLGIGTLLGMHLSDEHFNKIKDEHIHVIMAGHIASDNLGMNLLLDKLEKKVDLKIIECSGFRRYRRYGTHSR